MKLLKLTLVAIFSIALLTAVLPSRGTTETKDPSVESTNHEVKTTNIALTMIDRSKLKKPTNG